MTLVRTTLTGAGDTTTGTTYTTAGFTVAAGDLLIAAFTFDLNAASGTVPTVGSTGTTLTGVTWTQIATLQWAGSNVDRLTAWYGVCASASTGVLTFIVPSANGAAWSVFSYTGHDPAGPVSAGVTGVDTDAEFGPLDVSALTGELTVWAAARATGTTGGTHTGATVIHDVTHASPSRNLVTLEEAGEQSPAITWGSASQAAGIAFKIRAVPEVPVEPEVPEIPEPPIDTEGCETLEYANPAGDSIRFVTLVEVTGRMMPPVAVSSIGVPAGHGASFRGAYHRERPVVTPVAAPGIFADRAELRRWARVLDPAKGEGTLTVVGGEWAGRRLRCVYEAGLDELAETSRSPLPATLIWRAAYPYWEDAVESSESVTQDATIHHWFPFLPLVLGASDSFESFSVTNEGDVVSWPVMTVTGPATDMEVTNLTTGQLWHVTGEVPAGATLTVDTRPGYKTVDVDGVNAFGRLTPESSLWGLAPGVNEVTVGGVLTTSATSINFTWRQAWLAA